MQNSELTPGRAIMSSNNTPSSETDGNPANELQGGAKQDTRSHKEIIDEYERRSIAANARAARYKQEIEAARAELLAAGFTDAELKKFIEEWPESVYGVMRASGSTDAEIEEFIKSSKNNGVDATSEEITTASLQVEEITATEGSSTVDVDAEENSET